MGNFKYESIPAYGAVRTMKLKCSVVLVFIFGFIFLISDIAKLTPLSMWALKEKWKSLDTSYLFF